jgi:hypothetical protein
VHGNSELCRGIEQLAYRASSLLQVRAFYRGNWREFIARGADRGSRAAREDDTSVPFGGVMERKCWLRQRHRGRDAIIAISHVAGCLIEREDFEGRPQERRLDRE